MKRFNDLNEKEKRVINKSNNQLRYATLYLMNARDKLINAILEDFEIMREGQKVIDEIRNRNNFIKKGGD